MLSRVLEADRERARVLDDWDIAEEATAKDTARPRPGLASQLAHAAPVPMPSVEFS